MIKNEARILQRCLSAAAPAVDAVLFVDTGSEDETQALARAFAERPCKLVEDAWEDFGSNRTKSLEHARRFASEELGWELERSYALVLDADALNAIAGDTQLQSQLRARARRGWRSVLTPHPLEAARLLGISAAQVQGDRLAAAGLLSRNFGCVAVLKGSGTVVAAPGELPAINPSGNARLASAGTGDVLAGAIGAALAAGLDGFSAACEAVYLHGQCADRWPPEQPLPATAPARRSTRSGTPSSSVLAALE